MNWLSGGGEMGALMRGKRCGCFSRWTATMCSLPPTAPKGSRSSRAGYEVARRARSLGIDGRLVALTGYGQTRDRERARAAGFDLHLVKPVSYDDLRRAFEL